MEQTKEQELNAKIKSATKWSSFAELLAKLLLPVVNMLLARLLTPDAFGVVVTITMITSFAEIFTDAGFQKYIIQYDFQSQKEQDECSNVAFFSNLFLSVIIWILIVVSSDSLATLVGSHGKGLALTIAGFNIVLTAFSSIQIARYRRQLDFRTLFKVRVLGVVIPLTVTVPLAYFTRNYWSLIWGMLVTNMINAVFLHWSSDWKPRFFYSIKVLRQMLSFTAWTVVEQISIWLTNYVDVFIVGSMLSQYYLGLYKTSSSLVGQIIGLITAVTTPILFSALSRLQDDEQAFQTLFFRFQKIVGILIFPIGVGIFLFSDLITLVLLGNQWGEASGFVGLWALTSSVTIVFSHYASEVYRAKGRPKLSVLSQFLHIIVLWPVVFIAVKYGFRVLYISRSIVRLESILVNVTILYLMMKLPIKKMIQNIMPSCISAIAMVLVYYSLPSCSTIWVNTIYMVLCALVYCCVLSVFKEERNILQNIMCLVKR